MMQKSRSSLVLNFRSFALIFVSMVACNQRVQEIRLSFQANSLPVKNETLDPNLSCYAADERKILEAKFRLKTNEKGMATATIPETCAYADLRLWQREFSESYQGVQDNVLIKIQNKQDIYVIPLRPVIRPTLIGSTLFWKRQGNQYRISLSHIAKLSLDGSWLKKENILELSGFETKEPIFDIENKIPLILGRPRRLVELQSAEAKQLRLETPECLEHVQAITLKIEAFRETNSHSHLKHADTTPLDYWLFFTDPKHSQCIGI